MGDDMDEVKDKALGILLLVLPVLLEIIEALIKRELAETVDD